MEYVHLIMCLIDPNIMVVANWMSAVAVRVSFYFLFWVHKSTLCVRTRWICMMTGDIYVGVF